MPTITPLRDDGRHLSEAQAAPRAGLAPSTFAKMRSRGEGPPYLKVGRMVLYPVDELDAWIQSRVQRCSPTPDRAA